MSSDYTLVCSKQDLASSTISNCLTEKYGFSEIPEKNTTFTSSDYPGIVLHISENNLLHLDNLDKNIPIHPVISFYLNIDLKLIFLR